MRKKFKNKAQATVEFCIIFPVMLLFFCCIFEFGRMFSIKNHLEGLAGDTAKRLAYKGVSSPYEARDEAADFIVTTSGGTFGGFMYLSGEDDNGNPTFERDTYSGGIINSGREYVVMNSGERIYTGREYKSKKQANQDYIKSNLAREFSKRYDGGSTEDYNDIRHSSNSIVSDRTVDIDWSEVDYTGIEPIISKGDNVVYICVDVESSRPARLDECDYYKYEKKASIGNIPSAELLTAIEKPKAELMGQEMGVLKDAEVYEDYGYGDSDSESEGTVFVAIQEDIPYLTFIGGILDPDGYKTITAIASMPVMASSENSSEGLSMYELR